jgi:hypothetical protein
LQRRNVFEEEENQKKRKYFDRLDVATAVGKYGGSQNKYWEMTAVRNWPEKLGRQLILKPKIEKCQNCNY